MAQTITVTNESNKPVSRVYIFNQDKSKTITTNKKGVADLSSFSNSDTLTFTHTGFYDTTFTKEDLAKKDYKLSLVESVYAMAEFVYAANKKIERKEDIPYRIEKIDEKRISFLTPQTSADLLQQNGGISVQKSQGGGGSPIIRGFEANRILLVVDGVRLNNAIYRSGHLQNAITIDRYALKNVEIFFGPGSLMYGSDALGGVIHFTTKKPIVSEKNVSFTKQFSSANNENSTNFNFNLGRKKTAAFFSFSKSVFGDVKMGKNRQHGYDDWGLLPTYATTLDFGFDGELLNEDPTNQVNTGYAQYDVLGKLLFQVIDGFSLIFNNQFSTSSNINRFDRLNDYSGGSLRFSEWYYGPQKRWLSSIKGAFTKQKKLYTKASINFYYQNIEESRVSRRFGSTIRSNQFEQVDIYGVNADFKKTIDSTSEFLYGVEIIQNKVNSSAFNEDIITGERSNSVTRYPDGESSLNMFSLYSNYQKKYEQSTLQIGLRYNQTVSHSTFLDTTFVKLPFQEINFNNGALTGSIGWVYKASEKTRINLIASTGYRNPNVDDYGKIFEKNDLVTVPNNFLKPEYAYNGEIGLVTQLMDDKIKWSSNVFYTFLDNAIVKRNFQLNGKDSLVYNGVLAKIQTNMNTSQAFIYGFNSEVEFSVSNSLNFNASINYTFGKELETNTPLAHIPPVFGRIALRHQKNDLTSSIYLIYNSWKRIEDFSLGSEDNAPEGTDDGYPRWKTLNYRLSWQAKDFINLIFGVENILDVHYKTFSSGISAPGRNFIASVRANF